MLLQSRGRSVKRDIERDVRDPVPSPPQPAEYMTETLQHVLAERLQSLLIPGAVADSSAMEHGSRTRISRHVRTVHPHTTLVDGMSDHQTDVDLAEGRISSWRR